MRLAESLQYFSRGVTEPMTRRVARVAGDLMVRRGDPPGALLGVEPPQDAGPPPCTNQASAGPAAGLPVCPSSPVRS
jgi:hypothetical protein